MSVISNLEIRVTESDRFVTSTSSKGNQIKWYKGGYYIKADMLGYEGLAEVLASDFAHQTNIGDFAGIVDYSPAEIAEGNSRYVGCACKNFLVSGQETISLERLLLSVTGKTFHRLTDGLPTIDKIKTVVDVVVAETKILNFGEWLTCLMEYDSIILNEDRHPHNISFIKKPDGNFSLMPLYDNGAAFLSDTTKDYPFQTALSINMRKVKSKPFSTDFKKQVCACTKLFGRQLKIYKTSQDVNMRAFDNIFMYDIRAKERALDIMRRRLEQFNSTE